MKELLTQYAEIKAAIKELEDQAEAIKPQIIEQLEVGTKYDIGTAVIELARGRAAWKYSEDTKQMELSLKERQKEEQQTGVAVQVLGEPYLVCKVK